MRISLLNNRYFMVGGTTRYVFNVQALLEGAGHVVLPFSNAFPQSEPAPTREYFVSPPGGRDAGVFFREGRMTPRRALQLFVRGAYDWGVRRAFERLLSEQAVDLAYSVNICNFLGPSVIDAARKKRIPYVLRLSDFNLICPAYLHLRNGQLCEDCSGGLHHAIRHRCLQGSLSVSAARVAAMQLHRWLGVYERVSRIVTPSAFLRDKLVAAGFAAGKIDHIPSFVDLDGLQPVEDWSGDELLFVGRLAPEKGPDTLIRAVGALPRSTRMRLVFIGDGDSGYVGQLHREAERLAPGRVEFTGFLSGGALRERFARARALALPARWYENMPNAVTEAMALARPVLASPLGSLPEQVEDQVTGALIEPDDVEGWSANMQRLAEDPVLAERWGRAGRLRAESDFAPARHYASLMRSFELARHGGTTGGAP